MSRAYLRLDPAFDERKADYPDGPYAALIACFCLAETQPERGRFRSLRYLKALLDRRGRHVQYLLDHGDLSVMRDGRVYVVGWDEWQEGDWKVTERVNRIRNRRNGQTVTPTVTPTVTGVTPTVTDDRLDIAVRSGAELSGARQPAVAAGSDGGIFDAYYRLTARAPSKGAVDWLTRLVADHSETRTIAALAIEHRADPTPNTLLSRVQTRLVEESARMTKAAEERKKRGAIEEQRDLAQRLEAMSPEERQRAEARAAEVRAAVAGLAK